MIKITLIVIVLLLVVSTFFVFPPSMGTLPKAETEAGISEKASIKTDAGDLNIMLFSKNADNPVLLVCGGGPGIPQYLLECMYPSALPEEFTVCYWDYRGTGLNYSKNVDSSAMTTDRYVKDTVAVTDYLAERFSCNKIYIMGHSFGTYIALKTVQAHPDKYACYLAMSQITDQKKSEYLAYDYMKACYEESGNTKMLEQFGKYDIRNSKDDYENYFFSGIRDKAMHSLGIGTARNMKSVITGIFLPSLRCKAYTQAQRIKIWKGKMASNTFPVTSDSHDKFNAFEDVPKVEIPVVFLVGKYDYTCHFSLQQKYYEELEAPSKAIYIFENSAHSPIYEEYDTAKRVLEETKEIKASIEETLNRFKAI